MTKNLDSPIISVVVPIYKEQGNIRPFLARIEPVLEKIGTYEIIFCLDPSPDESEAVVLQEIERNPRIGLILFSRRFGQPAATMAGVLQCSGESCVVIDIDLQDPPELIGNLHSKLQEGYEVVYAKRRSRKGETKLKMLITHVGYRLINVLSDVSIPQDTGDFRIMTRRVIEELRRLHETHGFLRGLVAFVGFKQTFVEYDRELRKIGKGNYNRFFGSLKIGLNGIVGFSNSLLALSSILGISVILIGIVIFAYYFITKFFFHYPYALGIPTLISLALLLGGTQLTMIGILGEYIGRIYDEVKRRPQFIVDRVVNLEKKAEITRSF